MLWRPRRGELDELADALMEGYVRWREQSAAVSATYRAWVSAAPDQREVAFAAYEATLDREADAAAEYKRLIDWATGRLIDEETEPLIDRGTADFSRDV
jgi:hypothetical protein